MKKVCIYVSSNAQGIKLVKFLRNLFENREELSVKGTVKEASTGSFHHYHGKLVELVNLSC